MFEFIICILISTPTKCVNLGSFTFISFQSFWVEGVEWYDQSKTDLSGPSTNKSELYFMTGINAFSFVLVPIFSEIQSRGSSDFLISEQISFRLLAVLTALVLGTLVPTRTSLSERICIRMVYFIWIYKTEVSRIWVSPGPLWIRQFINVSAPWQ